MKCLNKLNSDWEAGLLVVAVEQCIFKLIYLFCVNSQAEMLKSLLNVFEIWLQSVNALLLLWLSEHPRDSVMNIMIMAEDS